ncbi:hypothetical protein GF339_22045 [candidate division KSB3 bacterium]|uniref:Flavodoxin-like domain-containing protein n=1 Tax=candidate division KSB3 bacterium TaxID=2044937 RepID=A0A9D5Q7V8_9BACT|nr:hypothetical protein [candidate division KSB3 bacterium]MBD3327284.1 hypothetical protein [candidate division KSB3 bacterium]
MKIAILYSPQHRKLETTAKALGQALEQQGHRVDYIQLGQSSRPPSVRTYDFLYVGSVMEGTFGGKVPPQLADALRQFRGFQNSKSATFTLKRLFGNTKGMKRLMALLESLGSQVMDFQVVSKKGDVDALAKRLRE